MFAWLLPMIVSMIALKYLQVEAVVVFRTLSTFGVALGDRYFFGKQFTQPALVAMLVTVGGGVLFALSDAHYTAVGYFWGVMYFLATIYNGLYIKLIFTQSVDMSNWEKTYYNNLMALPVTLLLILGTESVSGIFTAIKDLSFAGWLVILLSGVMGTAISVAGTNTRDLLSATSFNIAGNINKFMSVGFSVVFLYVRPPPLPSPHTLKLLCAQRVTVLLQEWVHHASVGYRPLYLPLRRRGVCIRHHVTRQLPAVNPKPLAHAFGH